MNEFKRKLGHLWRLVRRVWVGLPPRERVFAGYDKMRRFYIVQQCVAHFERRLDDPAPLLHREVLDIGCGTSQVAEFMVLSGGEVTALDVDKDVIESSVRRAEKYGADITFIEGRVEDLIHNDNCYDVVICLDLFEYIDNLDKFLWVVRRLLKPEGLLVFSAIKRTPFAWFVHIFLSGWVYKRTPRGSRKYAQFYNPDSMASILARQGLSVGHTQGLAFDLKDERWLLSDKISTRYLGVAALTPQDDLVK